jgi:hypothetical protein
MQRATQRRPQHDVFTPDDDLYDSIHNIDTTDTTSGGNDEAKAEYEPTLVPHPEPTARTLRSRDTIKPPEVLDLVMLEQVGNPVLGVDDVCLACDDGSADMYYDLCMMSYTPVMKSLNTAPCYDDLYDDQPTRHNPLSSTNNPSQPPTRIKRRRTRLDRAEKLAVYSNVHKTYKLMRNNTINAIASIYLNPKTPATEQILLNLTPKKAIAKLGDIAINAMKEELEQLHKRPTWKGVSRAEFLNHKARRRIIRSKLFLKEKTLPSGEFDKLKARLVAGGHMQDRELYDATDTESPTIATISAFIIACLAAHEERYVASIDIKGAYLNASLDPNAEPIWMSIDAILTEIIVSIDPSFAVFVRHDGSSVVELTRALYGLIESAKLWNDHITATLLHADFTQNPYDPCVFNMLYDGEQILLDCMLMIYWLHARSKRELTMLHLSLNMYMAPSH